MSIEILKKYNIKAKKKLGQNFLVNDEILENISDIVNVFGKNIIEVGPGYGALTEKLLDKNPKSLDLVELDKDMIGILEDRIKSGDLNISKIDFKINNIDILKFIPEYINYYVIANIPYYITSPILRHFLYNIENSPEKMIILMQKDVGDRIINEKKSSVLSLIIAKKTKVIEKLFVGKHNFIPSPKVESSVLLFEKHNKFESIDDEKFLKIIKKAFVSPRKKLIKNLAELYEKEFLLKELISLGFNENTRPEELDIEAWCNLIINL